MTKVNIIVFILIAANLLLDLFCTRYYKRHAKFWENSSEHWRRMFEEAKYGKKYNMPKNYNTAKNPFDVHFED